MDLFEWVASRRGEEHSAVLVSTGKAIDSHTPSPAPPKEAPAPRAKREPLTGQIAHAPLLITPRDYQEEFRGLVHAHFAAGHKRGLGLAATGAGKTVLFAAITADYTLTARRVLILVDQFDLVDQAVEKLRDVAGILADIEQGDRGGTGRAAVVVATVQTLGGRLEKYPPNYFDLIVCDECDRAVAPQWVKVLEHFHDHANVLGVTATGNRHDRRSIMAYFETKVFEIGLLELIARGFLVPISVLTLPLTIDLTDCATDGEDFDPEKVGYAVEACFGDVANAIKVHAPDRKKLVFLPDRRTSKKFTGVCLNAGINARHIDGESDDRREIKKDFRAGRIGLLSNPMLLTRGYDEPSVDCIINLRPTKSEPLYWQMIGRGTRLFCPRGCGGPCTHPERKKDLLIIDFLYQFKELGPIRPAALLADTPGKREAMTRLFEQADGQMDLLDVERQASEVLEKSLLAAMMEAQKKHRGKQGEYFSALDFAANLRIPDLLEYVPETDRDAAPPTPQLLKRIAAAGLVPETVFCQGHGERILAALKARKEAGMASPKAVFWLRKWGYRDPENTRGEDAIKIMRKEFSRAGKF